MAYMYLFDDLVVCVADLHFYDLLPGVADCTNVSVRWARRVERHMRRRTVEARREWIGGRVKTELLLHVLHARGIINWVQ